MEASALQQGGSELTLDVEVRSGEVGVGFAGIVIEILDRLGDFFLAELPLTHQPIQRRQSDAGRIDLEMSPQGGAGFAASHAVGPQNKVVLRQIRHQLFPDGPHVVAGRNDRANEAGSVYGDEPFVVDR